MNRQQLLTRARQEVDSGRFAASLARRVAWRTESDLGDQGGAAPMEAMHRYFCAEIQPALHALGFETAIHDNPVAGGGPFLLARRIEDPRLPTLLSYGHGDVVQGQAERWLPGLDPWVLTHRADRWYGRGTADNKGQHSIVISALAQVLQARQHRLGYNITLLLEMGEEAGSPGLAAFCSAQCQALKADLFLACDGPRVHADHPTLFLGSRGAVNFSLEVKARAQAYHSGNWGGVLSNPAVRLGHALACLVSAQGRILVPGLRAPALSPRLRQVLAPIPVGQGLDDPALTEGWGEPGLSPAERLIGCNSLDILALGAGDAKNPVNAVPASALAHCQLRFVVGTEWRKTMSYLRAHLDQHGFADVDIAAGMACAATRLDLDNPWVDWAVASMQASTGKTVALLPNLAGSLPNHVFADGLGLPTLWVPHSYPACAQHAPNEHMLVATAREGMAIMAGLFWDLGESPIAPWTAGRLSDDQPPVGA